MRTIKLILVVVLILVGALFGYTEIQDRISGKDEGPRITSSLEILDISVKDEENVLLQGLTASDPQDGDLTAQIMVAGVSKLISADKAKVTYLVFDSDDNMAKLERFVRYTDYRKPTFVLNGPLNFSASDSFSLLDHLGAEDVIDGDLSEKIRVSSLWAADTDSLHLTGDREVYYITAQVTNSMGDTAQVKLPVQMGSGIASGPQIDLTDYLVYVDQGASFDAGRYLNSAFYQGTRIPDGDILIKDQVNTDETGNYWVYYSYSENGAQGLAILTVVVQ